MTKTYIELTETSNQKWFKWSKDWLHYYVFSAGDEKREATGVIYWALCYSNEETFNQKLEGERVDADFIASIKEFTKEDKSRLGWMLFKNEEKKAYFVNLYDNEMKTPEKNYDKLLVLTETEYREKPQAATAPAGEANF